MSKTPVKKYTYKRIDTCDDNDTLVIDNTGLLDVGRIQENMPEGRCIVDLSFTLKEIRRTYENHKQGIDCQYDDWLLIVNYRRRGLLTQLFYKCQMCHYETNIWSEPTESDQLDINTAAVATTITAGIGYSSLEEICTGMNISCMSEKTYIKYRENVIDDYEKTAMQNMKKAAEEEKQLALEKNETINGIPYITVVADGSWMKRSYGSNYDSPCGVGAIIGYNTKKILFVGIRNKYCAICDVAERKSCEPKAHKCYKNFDSNASSTRMESDAIVEGFKNSLEMHGLIYKVIVMYINLLKTIIHIANR